MISRMRRRQRNNIFDIFHTIASGSFGGLVRYLEAGGDADLSGPDGYSLLMQAVEEGSVEKVDALLQAGCDVNKSDSTGCTPVHLAIHKRQAGILKLLLIANADVNLFHRQTTPLTLAAKNNDYEAAKLLLLYGSGCNVNLENYYKETALSQAIISDAKDICKLLLQNGASILKCYHSNFKTKINKHLCYNFGLMETFLTFSEEIDLHYHLLMSCIYHKKDVARLILHHFPNPFQLKGLGFITKQEEEDFWLDMAQSVIRPYGLATKCSTENQLLLMLLNFCDSSELAMQRQNHKSRAVTVMRVLIEHGLVIHPQTSLKACGFDCECRQCIMKAQEDLPLTSSLKGQCCSRIRQCLGGHINSEMVSLLHLPSSLKQYILLQDW